MVLDGSQQLNAFRSSKAGYAYTLQRTGRGYLSQQRHGIYLRASVQKQLRHLSHSVNGQTTGIGQIRKVLEVQSRHSTGEVQRINRRTLCKCD